MDSPLACLGFAGSNFAKTARSLHFGGKTWQPLSSYFENNKRERCCGGNNLSNVTSFIILRSGGGLTSSNKDNILTYLAKKSTNEGFQGVYFPNRRKNLNHISLSLSFSSRTVKVSIVKCHVTSNKRQWLCFASLMKELLFPYSHETAREYFLECRQESYANYVIIFGFFVSFYRHREM